MICAIEEEPSIGIEAQWTQVFRARTEAGGVRKDVIMRRAGHDDPFRRYPLQLDRLIPHVIAPNEKFVWLRVDKTLRRNVIPAQTRLRVRESRRRAAAWKRKVSHVA